MKRLLLCMFFIVCLALPCGCGAKEYRQGSSGYSVFQLQRNLTSLGFDTPITGIYDDRTASAVRQYQKSRRLAETGVCSAPLFCFLVPDEKDGHSGAKALFIRKLVMDSLRYVGVPYAWGGTTPDGFDCSGFVQFLFAELGIPISRTADIQYLRGEEISRDRLEVGDLVFFETYEPGASHIGLYLGKHRFIQASGRSVKVSDIREDYWASRFLSGRRYIH